jgi:hypothetical protein
LGEGHRRCSEEAAPRRGKSRRRRGHALDDEAAMKALALVDVVANAVRGKTAEQLISKFEAHFSLASQTRRRMQRIIPP